MRRRDFFWTVLVTTVVGLPRLSYAAVRSIGVLVGLASTNDSVVGRLAAFREGLSNSGWVEGQQVKFEYRFEPDQLRLAERAAELVNRGCEVIVTWSTPEVLAAMAATKSTPIVFLAVADPIGSQIVQSLARPGGNVTGTTNFEPGLGSKWVGLLCELSPSCKRIAVLTNTQNPAERRMQLAVENAATTNGLACTTVAAQHRDDLNGVLESFAAVPNGGIVVIPGIATNAASNVIVDLADQLHLPAVYPFDFFAKAGGLISYGVDGSALAKRAATYVDRVLRGVSPTDLPVEGPTRFELVINLRSARHLGLTVPPTLLATADEVIE